MEWKVARFDTQWIAYILRKDIDRKWRYEIEGFVSKTWQTIEVMEGNVGKRSLSNSRLSVFYCCFTPGLHWRFLNIVRWRICINCMIEWLFNLVIRCIVLSFQALLGQLDSFVALMFQLIHSTGLRWIFKKKEKGPPPRTHFPLRYGINPFIASRNLSFAIVL